MKISRRDFLLLTAGLTAGCQAVNEAGNSGSAKARAVNAGQPSSYAADGVYSNFRDLGFFLVRRGDKLFALSSYCTHRKCKLTAMPDRSFYCECHGSTFDPAGHVTKGPAKLDLPVLPAHANEEDRLVVDVPAV